MIIVLLIVNGLKDEFISALDWCDVLSFFLEREQHWS